MKRTPNTTIAFYHSLPANERQEFRLSVLLKDHLHRAALATGQTLTEYITDALAERVTQDLSGSPEWLLTVEEQAHLLKILASTSAEPSERARLAAERADRLFGPLPSRESH